ncbi:MAG: sigma-54-dependent Fis family transcriptional regulator [Spartobacteria bacterium]|nr:sigma-54-dependent Fis family transcriptional regulator [Spartobacteria bacterium]
MADESSSRAPLLLVDDEPAWLRSFSRLLRHHGMSPVHICSSGEEVLAHLFKGSVAGIIMDWNMPELHGRDLLLMLKAQEPDLPVMVLSGVAQQEVVHEAFDLGAFDFCAKSDDPERMISSVQRMLQFTALTRRNHALKNRITQTDVTLDEAFEHIITNNESMLRLFDYVRQIAWSQEPVFIKGETGVGKELFAQAVHRASKRTGKFVAVNVAALDEQMFSDALFGHKKGAFTHAVDHRKGLVRRAEKGTLFLDEIGDIPMAAQIKLLRLLQEKEFYPTGSDQAVETNARIVVASHTDLKALVEAGCFRADLFYRLQTHQVVIPPLRERKNDIPLLASHFIIEAADSLNADVISLSLSDLDSLIPFHYGGNVRELRSLIYDFVSRCAGCVSPGDILKKVLFARSDGTIAQAEQSPMPYEPGFSDTLPTMKEWNWLLIDEALRRSDGHQGRAARMLGISRQALNQRLNKRGKG